MWLELSIRGDNETKKERKREGDKVMDRRRWLHVEIRRDNDTEKERERETRKRM